MIYQTNIETKIKNLTDNSIQYNLNKFISNANLKGIKCF